MSAKVGQTDKIALLTARGFTASAVARMTGLSAKTIGRRRADPAFAEKVEKLRAGLLDRSIGLLADGMADAIKELRRLCKSGKGETIRLQAARALCQLLLPTLQQTTVETKLTELEAQIERITTNQNDAKTHWGR